MNSKKLIEEIILALERFKYKGDESDVGNEIGVVVGKLTPDEVESFVFGLKHGISLSNGTH